MATGSWCPARRRERSGRGRRSYSAFLQTRLTKNQLSPDGMSPWTTQATLVVFEGQGALGPFMGGAYHELNVVDLERGLPLGLPGVREDPTPDVCQNSFRYWKLQQVRSITSVGRALAQ